MCIRDSGYAGDRYGYNFTDDKGYISYDDPNDTGHGTHVAGIISACLLYTSDSLFRLPAGKYKVKNYTTIKKNKSSLEYGEVNH